MGILSQAPFSGFSFDGHFPQSTLGETQPVSDEQAAQVVMWVWMVGGGMGVDDGGGGSFTDCTLCKAQALYRWCFCLGVSLFGPWKILAHG